MKSSRIKLFFIEYWIWLLGIVLIATVATLPRSPYVAQLPGIDSSVFIYIGERIASGEVPYLDVWDHKGPIPYFINAFAVLLTPGSYWGIWIVQWILLIFSLVFAFIAPSMFFRKSSSLAGIIWAFSFYLKFRGGGNFTEEYALFPMFAAILIYGQVLKKQAATIHYILIGNLFAISFLTRANHIGLFLAILISETVRYIEMNNWNGWKKFIFELSSGFLIINLLFILYFGLQNALVPYFDAAYNYNFSYSSQSFSLEAWFASTKHRLGDKYIPLFAPYVFYLIFVIRLPKLDLGKKYFLLFSGLVLPLDFLFSNSSGLGFDHYFLILLPGITLVAAYSFELIADWTRERTKNIKGSRWLNFLSLVLFGFIFVLPRWNESIKRFGPFIGDLIEQKGAPTVNVNGINPHVLDLAEFLKKNPQISRNPYLLVWGNGVLYNLTTDKVAPTRFVYQFALNSTGYVSEEMVLEFVEGIRKHRPIVFDTSDTFADFPEIGSSDWDDEALMKLANDYILENYVLSARIGPKQYPLYVPK